MGLQSAAAGKGTSLQLCVWNRVGGTLADSDAVAAPLLHDSAHCLPQRLRVTYSLGNVVTGLAVALLDVGYLYSPNTHTILYKSSSNATLSLM